MFCQTVAENAALCGRRIIFNASETICAIIKRPLDWIIASALLRCGSPGVGGAVKDGVSKTNQSADMNRR